MAPSDPLEPASLDILFQTPEGDELRTFTKRPLGMEFLATMPLTVNMARFHARQQGVQRGWVIKEIGGKSLESVPDFLNAFSLFKDAVAPLREDHTQIGWPPFSVSDMMARVRPVPPAVVPRYLVRFRYRARNHLEWATGAENPELKVWLDGHKEEGIPYTHTWYFLRCELTRGGEMLLSWHLQRRLAHLRTCLHDPIKRTLGRRYGLLFANARFARRSGPPGTSERLALWLQELCWHLKEGSLPPGLVALVLRFLEAPEEQEPLQPPKKAAERAAADEAAAEEDAAGVRTAGAAGAVGALAGDVDDTVMSCFSQEEEAVEAIFSSTEDATNLEEEEEEEEDGAALEEEEEPGEEEVEYSSAVWNFGYEQHDEGGVQVTEI